jgi:Uma2 family endonuclease
MQIEIEPQPRALERWQERLADPEFARLPFKIETDRFGRVLMSSPPAFDHTRFVAKIIRLLSTLLPEGQVVAETPVLTPDGVKVTDAAWFSSAYWEELENQRPPALKRAPEICIQILSPSNSPAEMTEKRALYLAAGAREVWLCGSHGNIDFYAPDLSNRSTVCPLFPVTYDRPIQGARPRAERPCVLRSMGAQENPN